MLTGSLRSNLDPFVQLDDAVLNDALRAAGLSALQEEMEDGKLTLDSEISAGGNNLSVGQRQIIALGEYNVQDYSTWHTNSLQLGRLFGEANS